MPRLCTRAQRHRTKKAKTNVAKNEYQNHTTSTRTASAHDTMSHTCANAVKLGNSLIVAHRGAYRRAARHVRWVRASAEAGPGSTAEKLGVVIVDHGSRRKASNDLLVSPRFPARDSWLVV